MTRTRCSYPNAWRASERSQTSRRAKGVDLCAPIIAAGPKIIEPRSKPPEQIGDYCTTKRNSGRVVQNTPHTAICHPLHRAALKDRTLPSTIDAPEEMPAVTQPKSASTAGPDQRGRFGAFGGTLRPRDAGLRPRPAGGRIRQGPGRRRVSGRARRPAGQLRRPALAALPRPAAERANRRRPDLAQTRRPQPHRRPQDQQHHRPGPAHPADGQDPRHRRDRRRAARRGHGHRVCPLRPAVRRVHGRGGHPPPGAQRVRHAAAGRRGAARDQRQPHAARRHQRGHARLDGERRRHALHPGLGRGPASVPADRPRLPVGDRPRDHRPVHGTAGPSAQCRRRVRRRRLQRGRHVLSVHRAQERRAGGRRSGRPQREGRRPRRAAHLGLARASCTAATAT